MARGEGGPAGAVLPHTPLAPHCPSAVSLKTPPRLFCNGPFSLSRPPPCEAAAASAATRAPQQPPPSPLPVSSLSPRSCRPCGSPCCGPPLPAATERRPQRGRSSTPPCPSAGTEHRPQRGRTSTPPCPSTERRPQRGRNSTPPCPSAGTEHRPRRGRRRALLYSTVQRAPTPFARPLIAARFTAGPQLALRWGQLGARLNGGLGALAALAAFGVLCGAAMTRLANAVFRAPLAVFRGQGGRARRPL